MRSSNYGTGVNPNTTHVSRMKQEIRMYAPEILLEPTIEFKTSTDIVDKRSRSYVLNRQCAIPVKFNKPISSTDPAGSFVSIRGNYLSAPQFPKKSPPEYQRHNSSLFSFRTHCPRRAPHRRESSAPGQFKLVGNFILPAYIVPSP
jgi:hypothetical protein